MTIDSLRTTRLENGLRVVTENVRDVASVALGVWVENGSRYENDEHNGISHFIEHLLFKGTVRRSAFAIAEEIECLGGAINAFTGKEYTCYHTRTLSQHAGIALDVLADILLHSSLREEDIETEREVIFQEIFDCEDSPEDFVHDYFLQRYWPGHSLGWTVVGSVETVARITRADIVAYLKERYRPDRMVVAAAGDVDHDGLVEMCRQHFAALDGSYRHSRMDRPDFHPGVFVHGRDLEQVHIVMGFPGISFADRRHDVAEVLVTAIGGGMSSRLFQKIREERGLAYNVYAFQTPFHDIGYTGVYAATSREGVHEVVEATLAELRAVTRSGLDGEELERTKQQLIGSIPLALESTDSRMFRIARNQIYFGREIPLAEVVAGIEAVTVDSVVALAEEIFAFERLGVAMLGDAEEDLVRLPAA